MDQATKQHAVVVAIGLITWYMRACGFAGWARFWNAIYVLPGVENEFATFSC